MVFLQILSRWLHVLMACLVIGGVFFVRFLLPRGLAVLEPDRRAEALLRIRRAFKMLIHSAILLLIITGIYNSMLAWKKYQLQPELLHPLWGTHILLALIAFAIALYVLAGKEPPRSHRRLMAINFLVLLLVVAAASTLKWAREKAVARQNASPASTMVNR